MSANDSVNKSAVSSSDSSSSSSPSSPPQALPWRLLERITAYKEPLELGLTLLLFGVALLVCWHLVSSIDLPSLHTALLGIPSHAIMGAVVATAVGFLILLGYEWSASRLSLIHI